MSPTLKNNQELEEKTVLTPNRIQRKAFKYMKTYL